MIARSRAGGIAAALSLVLLVGAVPAPAQEFGGDPVTPEMRAKRREIMLKLNSLKLSLDFTDAQLTDVIEFCREVAQINFVIDKRVFEKLSPQELSVTMKLTEVPLRVALKLVLEPKNLATIFRDGVLMIVPKEVLEEELVLQIYDVKDLMFKIVDFPGPDLELAGGGGSAGGVGAVFGETTQPTILTDPGQLTELIKKTVGGDTWERVPGTSVAITNGVLMVVQSRKIQREIAEMVMRLRQFK